MGNIRDCMIAPFSSAYSEVFSLICCGGILLIVMVIVIMTIAVLVGNVKRYKSAVMALKIYMADHPSEANLIKEFESVSVRMRKIFEEAIHSKDSEHIRFSTIVEIFRKAGRD